MGSLRVSGKFFFLRAAFSFAFNISGKKIREAAREPSVPKRVKKAKSFEKPPAPKKRTGRAPAIVVADDDKTLFNTALAASRASFLPREFHSLIM